MKTSTQRRRISPVPVSIVIPTLNEEHHLPRLLGSLLACESRSIEIIVVDGGSEDGTLEVVNAFRRRAPKDITVRALVSPVRNVAHQRNLGAAQALHETLLFLDADTAIPTPETLDAILDRFREGGYAAASCRAKPLDPDLRGTLYYNGLYLFQNVMARRRPYGLGACLATRRAVFRRCGGFDPTIRVGEDVRYCQDASRYGRFGIFPTAIGVSTRRFARYGYFRTGLKYSRMFLEQCTRGEICDDRFRYEFGKFD